MCGGRGLHIRRKYKISWPTPLEGQKLLKRFPEERFLVEDLSKK